MSFKSFCLVVVIALNLTVAVTAGDVASELIKSKRFSDKFEANKWMNEWCINIDKSFSGEQLVWQHDTADQRELDSRELVAHFSCAVLVERVRLDRAKKLAAGTLEPGLQIPPSEPWSEDNSKTFGNLINILAEVRYLLSVQSGDSPKKAAEMTAKCFPRAPTIPKYLTYKFPESAK